MVDNNTIVRIVSRIAKNNGAPCKKTLQKIVYLIQAKDMDLGCEYGIHFYGPYSADLDFAIRELNDEGILKIDYTPTEHRISVIDSDAENGDINIPVNKTIDEFSKESPNELELIATALYIYTQVRDVEKIRDGVIKIKGNKYTDSRIDKAIDRLKDTGYITA